MPDPEVGRTTTVVVRAPQLEPHDEFEGIGAHELNPRYTNVDGYAGYEADLEGQHETMSFPRLLAAQARQLLAPTPIRLDGPDVAHYQVDATPGGINWAEVKAAPCVWAACKLTQSTGYLDPTAARSRQSMSAVAFRHRGVYHWLSSTTDPERQAAWFLKQLGTLGSGEFVMLDDEEAGVTVDKTLAWLAAVEAITRRPSAVYSGAFVAAGAIWTSPAVREGKYGPRPMVLAAYTTEARARALPGVAAHPWSSWQFSSNGPVPGISGRCDMNRVDDWAVYDLAAGITSTPAPTPEPPITQGDAMPATITNSQPHDLGDGHGPYKPLEVYWEVEGGHKVHIANGTILKAYGGAARAVPMDENELAAIPDLTEHLGELAESGPMTFTGTIASVPGTVTLTVA